MKSIFSHYKRVAEGRGAYWVGVLKPATGLYFIAVIGSVGACSSDSDKTKPLCDPMQIFCLGTTRVQCSSDGVSVTLVEDCGIEQSCSAEGCVPANDGTTVADTPGPDDVVDVQIPEIDGSELPDTADLVFPMDGYAVDAEDSEDSQIPDDTEDHDGESDTDEKLPPSVFDDPVIVSVISNEKVGTGVPASGITDLFVPHDIVFNNDDTVLVLYGSHYATGGTSSWVVKRTLEGEFISQWFAISCVAPGDVSTSYCETMVTVENPPTVVLGGAGPKWKRLHFVTLDGIPIRSVGEDPSSFLPSDDLPPLNELSSVRDLCVHQPTSRIYVVDGYSHRVVVYSAEGVALFQFGGKGYGKGALDTANACLVQDTTLYVSGSGRINVFDLDGNYLSSFGTSLSPNNRGMLWVNTLTTFSPGYFLAASGHLPSAGPPPVYEVYGYHIYSNGGKVEHYVPTDFLGDKYMVARRGPNDLMYIMRNNPTDPQLLDSNYYVVDFGVAGGTSETE